MKSFEIGPGLRCDLERLVTTRLLVQANSGGGKSWLLRRLLEQTAGKIQQLVIDPEGEFSTLRERFDYVLAAKSGGDTAADPRTAKLLAERLLELRVSAILDIYELDPHARILFVRRFLEALVDAPKALWHPALVVVDEAHTFCPEVGNAESATAVKALATRGRKRGFCAVFATQRLSKFAKDAAAECNNKLIGRTSLDVDMVRAGDELGFSKPDRQQLREVDDGEFFAFGPALSRTVTRVSVGPVRTTHPEAGGRLALSAPPPTSRVKALLPKLADLPAEAADRERTLDELKAELATTKRELTIARKEHPAPVAATKVVEKFVLKDGQMARLEKLYERIFNEAERHATAIELFWKQQSDEAKAMLNVLTLVAGEPTPPFRPADVIPIQRNTPTTSARVDRQVPATSRPASLVSPSSDRDKSLPLGERRVLVACAQYPGGVSREQLTILTGYKRSTRDLYLQGLGRRGYVQSDRDLIAATSTGVTALGDFERLPTGAALREHWMARLPLGERAVLEVVTGEHPHKASRDMISERTGYKRSTRDLYLQALQRRKLIATDREGVVAAPELFG